mgnify:CR=1 FL=1
MRAIILGSGSKGNSTLLIGNDKKILIDVGFSFPQMTRLLNNFNIEPALIDVILITHTHKDHVIGLSSFVKKTRTPVYTNSVMFSELSKIVPEEYLVVNDDLFDIGEFSIETFHTSHDAKGSVGFIIKDDLGSLVYVTDTGYINKVYLERLKNKNAYIFESNHDINMLMTGPYPYILKQRVVSDTGHLSNIQSGNYLKELIGTNTKRIVLAHLSETNNTHELAISTVKDIINSDISLTAAYQDESLDLGDIHD